MSSSGRSARMRVIDIPISYHDIVSSASEIPVDENHCKLHRIGRLAIARGKARLAVGPDFQNLRGQFRAELHLLLDAPLTASRHAEVLFDLRHHRLAIRLGSRVEVTDRIQHPSVSASQEWRSYRMGQRGYN